MFGVPPPVTHQADHSSHQQQEGGAPRGAGDEGDVGGLEGAVLTPLAPEACSS